jgi:lipoyl(octanoyl) transferase
MPKVIFKDIGETPYQKAWDFQTQLHNEVKEAKIARREWTEEEKANADKKNYLVFCSHPAVYTLGKSGKMDNLLLNEKQLEEKEIEFFKINRGGDITFHGPGQIVGYPIFDMDEFFTDIHKYVRLLEEVIIRTLADFNVDAGREEGFTGVWLPSTSNQPKRKICAIGVHLSRWVTMHGFAFNVNTELNYFNFIVPCGIDDSDKAVTSLSAEIGKNVDFKKVKVCLKKHFAQLFKIEYV